MNNIFKKYNLIFRIAADILTIALVAYSPIWAVLLASIAFAWIFAPYYEIIVVGLIMDSLYGLHSFYGIIMALVIFVIIEVMKRRTRI